MEGMTVSEAPAGPMPKERRIANLGILIGGTAAGAGVVTLLVSILPWVDFAYRSRPLHVAIETAASIIGLLAAYLLLGRYRRSASLRDLLLVGAFLLLAGTNLCFSSLPAMSGGPPGRFETWSPVAGSLLGALALAAAAFAPTGRVRAPRRDLLIMLGACAGLLAVIAAGVALLGHRLPVGIDPDVSVEGSRRPWIVGNGVLLAGQVAGVLLFAAAAVGFARRAARTDDELMGWIAAGALLAAFARLNYFLFPSLYTDWVYTGDFLRLGFYLALLAGALREIRAYQEQLALAATLEERQRIARELHDGLAQDLAFISTQTQRLAATPRNGGARPEELKSLSVAAARALDESRDAIAALIRPTEEPLDATLTRAAEEVAGRAAAKVTVNAAGEVHVSPEARDSLVRIVREAITNAVRHGGATDVEINLLAADGLTLTIRDNGSGLARCGRRGGFGLTSMRQRAERLGGHLSIASNEGEGTVVEVRLPARVLGAISALAA
jgi:signal transduction histidine kinase